MKAYGPRKWHKKSKVGARLFLKKILSVNIALRNSIIPACKKWIVSINYRSNLPTRHGASAKYPKKCFAI